MKIQKAIMGMYDGEPAMVLQAPKSDILAFLRTFENKYPCDVEITLLRKKRSHNANSYMWVLCDRIAEAVGTTKTEVYKSHIREVGVFDDIWIKSEAVDTFCKNWESNGTGWVAERMYSRGDWTSVRAYSGSSTYDSKQMARLIDNVIHEAKGLGIETLTRDELERMKQAWNTR